MRVFSPTIRSGLIAAAAAVLPVLPASGTAPPAPACAPAVLNGSAALAGVTVSPAPGSAEASYLTQISFLGLPAADIEGVVVLGSSSGPHAGQLAAYSQGDGASFLPATPFAQGELVTVQASVREGERTTPVSWQFTVAERDAASHSLETPPPPAPPARAREYQRFLSDPSLAPPTVTVAANSGRQAPGYVFLAPYAGPGQFGPMILDRNGGLVWFDPVPAHARAADLRVQEWEGRPVMTWWQDPLISGGRSDSAVVIADSSYRDVAVVRAGNGYEPDLHAFKITPQGTALFTVYAAIRCNLSAYGGPADGAVADTLLQELDLKTGLVRYEWHSLDHVALSDSYLPVRPGGTPVTPWDYFHINALDLQPGGALLVNARNTWAAYELDARSGQISWRLGGKHSSFALPPGASPAWQHDARLLSPNTITFFDNGAGPKVHPQSRGIVLALNTQSMSASLLASFVHPTPLVSESQGDFQSLADGDRLIGWGQEPYLSEFAPGGQLLFDARLPAPYQSFTAFKYPWSGSPTSRPRIAVRPRGHLGVAVYASWNGATAVARWQLLAGASPRRLRGVASVPRRGFETVILLRTPRRYFAVRALDARGGVLGSSAVARY